MEINKSLEEIQENKVKQIEVLKGGRMNPLKKYRKIQLMVEEETAQDLKMEVQTIRKTKTEVILEIENPER